jgi:hypothetical protein
MTSGRSCIKAKFQPILVIAQPRHMESYYYILRWIKWGHWLEWGTPILEKNPWKSLEECGFPGIPGKFSSLQPVCIFK